MTIDEILEAEVTGIYGEMYPGQAIPPEVIASIILAMIQAIQQCRQNQAQAQINSPGLKARFAAIRAARKAGIGIFDSVHMSDKIIKRLQLAPQATKDAIVAKAFADAPSDEDSGPATGPFPTALIAFALAAVSMIAQTAVAAGPFPVAADPIPVTNIWDVDPVVTTSVHKPVEPIARHQAPHSQNWELNVGRGYGNHTQAELVDHLVEDRHPHGYLRREYLEGLTTSELKAVHSSAHEGKLSKEFYTASPTVTTQQVAYKKPDPQPVAVKQQPQYTQQTYGLFGRRTRSVQRIGGGCPGGTCPTR